MDLSKRILYSISKGIYQGLYEARNISHRTIDRKLWLSVQSVISRNRSSEAEFIKPMKKLTKEDLLNRYVAALLIMKKPCPKNEKDIEKLKTLKLFAQKAIQLGATIDDIQNLYNINSGNTQNPQNVKQGFDPSKLPSSKETAREKLGKYDYKEYTDSLKDQLANKELNGQYLYKYYVSYGFGFGSNGFSVGERNKKDDNARRYVLGTYLMSNEKYDIFVSRYTRLITKWARSSWDREVAGKMVIGNEGLNLRYIPKLYETKEGVQPVSVIVVAGVAPPAFRVLHEGAAVGGQDQVTVFIAGEVGLDHASVRLPEVQQPFPGGRGLQGRCQAEEDIMEKILRFQNQEKIQRMLSHLYLLKKVIKHLVTYQNRNIMLELQD